MTRAAIEFQAYHDGRAEAFEEMLKIALAHKADQELIDALKVRWHDEQQAAKRFAVPLLRMVGR